MHHARAVSTRFSDALGYAAEMHATQVRKGTQVPYVAHLLAVAAIVLEAGGSEDEAIAALLHDGPEDQGGRERLEEIRTRFGERVAHIVDHCSDTFETPKPDWATRKAAYVRRLAAADTSALLVSTADKLHNAHSTLRDLRTIGVDATFRRFNATPGQIVGNYYELIGAYRSGASDRRREPLVEELRETVGAIAGYL